MQCAQVNDPSSMSRLAWFPLTLARQGERVRIAGFHADLEFRQRFLAMGVGPGEVVVVFTRNSDGSVIIDKAGSRIALNSNFSHKINVTREY